MSDEIDAIRDGFVQLNTKMDEYRRHYIEKELFDRLINMHDSFIHQNSVRLNQLELRQEELSRFAEQIKHNSDIIARLETRMDNAPGKNVQFISVAISLISVIVVLFQHVKIG